MKKYLLIISGLLIIGLNACQKENDAIVASSNSPSRGAVVTNNPGADEPLEQADWKIGLFIDDGKDLTVNYQYYVFHFGENNVLTITDMTARYIIEGYWQITGEGTSQRLTIDIESLVANDLTRLNGIWTVLTFDVNTMIDLVMDNGAKRLRFNRI
jgi:hypothetical protein